MRERAVTDRHAWALTTCVVIILCGAGCVRAPTNVPPDGESSSVAPADPPFAVPVLSAAPVSPAAAAASGKSEQQPAPVASPGAPAADMAAAAVPWAAAGRDDTPEVPTPRSAGSGASRRVSFPLRPGATNDITFDDLELDMPLGTLFDRAMLTPRAAQLDGQKVRIRGFIYAGGVFQQSGITSFPLVKNTECKFGPQGLAYCVILVDLDQGVKTEFTTYPVTVEGTLSVRPFNSGGFTWSVYHLQGQRVF